MNLITKHYEKIILAVLMIVFVAALFWQLLMINQSAKPISKSEEDELDKMPANYAHVDLVNFSALENIYVDSSWRTFVSREGHLIYSDMYAFPSVARCNLDGCKKLIPMSDYDKKKCSYCGQALNATKYKATTDRDKDGIPDEVELLIGTDPKLADSNNDVDGDSWSNLEEYRLILKAGSKDYDSIKNPLKHPSLHCYLCFVKAEKKAVDIYVNSGFSTGDKNNWKVFLKVNGESKTAKIGESIRTKNGLYKLDDIKIDHNEENNSKIYKIKILNEQGDPIVIKQKETSIFEPKPKVYLSFNMSGEANEIIVLPGQIFKIGSDLVGYEEYTIAQRPQNKFALMDVAKKEIKMLDTVAERGPGGQSLTSTDEIDENSEGKSEEQAIIPGI